METCHLFDFMQALEPWLSDDYIREAHLDADGRIVIQFVDGVKNVYHIDDCSGNDIHNILQKLKDKGITVITPPL